MIVNGKELNVDKLVDELNIEDNFMHDVGNGIYLSKNQISILKRNNFDYKKYSSLSNLIFDIEEYLMDNSDCDIELENLVSELAEINYYKNTKK